MSVWDKIVQFVKDWGTNPLIVALISSILTLVIVFFRKIAREFGRLFSWLWAKMRGKGADRAFEKHYLDWLISQHRHLGLLPAQIVTRKWGERPQFVDLEDVYVKLSMSIERGDENWDETYGEGGSSWRKRPWLLRRLLIRLRLFNRTEQTYHPGDLGLVIDRHKLLVIRGDPGSGKTTLLRYLAVTCARTLRKNIHDGDSSRLVKKRLLWNTRPFPILVSLRRHGMVASWDRARQFTDIFLEELPSDMRNRCPKRFFDQRLTEGNCLILLDAFDELDSPEVRNEMARQISGFLEIYNRPDNRTVITTRIIGYEGQLGRYGFIARTVQNLEAGEIRALVKQRYKAIALAESAQRKSIEDVRAIKQAFLQRSEHLIVKIEDTPPLNQLATNPMLLSLIVLVHSINIELPEQRRFLYRDCVEILTERWQKAKREEEGLKKEVRDELTLSQKLILLREIAFAIQQQRQEEGHQALLPRDTARDLIADKLPDFLGRDLPQQEIKRREVYHRKAEEWMDGILEQSGILVEQGLDQSGEPLVGFSHLTFQEYLAAVALDEVLAYQKLLWDNLLEPAWREVILLYVALASDATQVIKSILESPLQLEGIVLAGYCLAEHPQKVETSIQQMTLAKLKEGFSQANDSTVSDFGKVMGVLGGHDITMFMRQQLLNPILSKQLAAIKALGNTRTDDPELEGARADLVGILETPSQVEITVAARESLAQIGDPRFSGPKPILVPISQMMPELATTPKSWNELITSPNWQQSTNFTKRFALITRFLDCLVFHKWRAILRRQMPCREFEIGKFPITNIEYSRFIDATGYRAPRQWIEGIYPLKEATHPVTGIVREDADAYCKWLSDEAKDDKDKAKDDKKCRYRLPTEWEWEWAATGAHKWKYAWGDQFDKDKCNVKESGLEGTTPVGSYLAGVSPYGASDMCGNIWELTEGCIFFSKPHIEYWFGVASFIIIGLLLGFNLRINIFPNFINIILNIFIILVSIVFILFGFLAVFELLTSTYGTILRGGAWNNSSELATCFYRTDPEDISAIPSKYKTRTIGFRCVKELSDLDSSGSIDSQNIT